MNFLNTELSELKLKLTQIFLVSSLITLIALLIIHFTFVSFHPVTFFINVFMIILDIGALLYRKRDKLISAMPFLFLILQISLWLILIFKPSDLPNDAKLISIIAIYVLSALAPFFMTTKALLIFNVGNIIYLNIIFFLHPLFASLSTQATGLFYLENMIAFSSFFIITHAIHYYREKFDQSLLDNISLLEKQVEEKNHNLEKLELSKKQIEEKNEKISSQIDSLSISKKKYSGLLEAANDAILLLKNWTILECNSKTEEIIGLERDSIIGRSLLLFSAGEQPSGRPARPSAKNYFLKTLRGNPQNFEWVLKQGKRKIITEITTNLFLLDHQQYIVAVVRDISARNKSDDLIETSFQIFNKSIEGLIITDAKGKILFVNHAFTRITGFEAKEVKGKRPLLLKSKKQDRQFYREILSGLLKNGEWSGEIWNRKKNGRDYPGRMEIIAVHNKYGEITKYISLLQDMTEAHLKENLLKYQEFYDSLTGLPNKIGFLNLIDQLIKDYTKEENTAIILLGLDNFRDFNDTYGYEIGDQVLGDFANRLSSIRHVSSSLSKLEGDVFGIVIKGFHRKEDLSRYIVSIQEIMEIPFLIDTVEHYLTISIGVYILYPEDQNAQKVIQNTFSALHQAKKKGRNQYQFFSDTITKIVSRRLDLKNKLKNSVLNEEISVYYQPKIDIFSDKIYGMEALLRWFPPSGEMIRPDEFISVAEESGLIIDIGQIVLNKACMFTKEINEDQDLDLQIAVNISPVQLEDKNFHLRLENGIARSGLEKKYIELEITESIYLSDEDHIKSLEEIRELGISLALDDFGTGYSSLSYLKRLPINTLKIDRSFVMDLNTSKSNRSLLRIIMEVAKQYDYKTVAEGVENLKSLHILQELACNYAQGYFFAPPLSEKEFISYLDRNKGNKFVIA